MATVVADGAWNNNKRSPGKRTKGADEVSKQLGAFVNCKVLKFGSGLASVSEIALISIGCNDSLFKRRKNSVP